MGASQSSGRGGGDASVADEQDVKTSYYELLGLQRHATDEEIKKAYRRKALELHPDRNYGNEESATRIFADVQSAYEVLSDPQERAWYDSHESAILRGSDGTGADEGPVYQNVRVTSADDLARLLRKFNSNVEFSDSPSGFFGFVRETFEGLAKEEEVAASWEDVDVRDYPTFGHKDDAYDDVPRHFYAAWSSFSTVKSFAWRDKYRLSEAPDRWYRRRMEQENKALRQEAKKEFNEAVRSLIAFIRKRDPRYVPSTQSEEERQKILRDAAASQAARARAANQAKLNEEDVVPEWAKAHEPEDEDRESGEEDEEEVEQEVWECVACNKIFKSERQWEAHEKSKKHQKAIHALRRKMRKENAHLDLEGEGVSSGVATPEAEEDEELEVGIEVDDKEDRLNGHASDEEEAAVDSSKDVDEEQDGVNGSPDEREEDATAHVVAEEEQPESEDSDYTSPSAIAARLQSSTLDTPSTNLSEDGEDAESQPTKSKLGKAAQKRAKKAAAAAATSDETNADNNNHKCATCKAAFPSKTRLFQHIKDHGHAAPKVAVGSSGGGGKAKKAKGKK